MSNPGRRSRTAELVALAEATDANGNIDLTASETRRLILQHQTIDGLDASGLVAVHGTRMRPPTATLFLASLALGACVHTSAQTPPAQSSVKETAAMTTPVASVAAGQDTAPLRPKLTAEQALTRLLELIRSAGSVQDLTPENLAEAFGLEVWRDGPKKYGIGEQVTKNWWYAGQVYEVPGEGTKFRFDFYPVVAGSSPDMTDICQLDSDQFGAALEAMGFSKQASYGEHGRLLGYIFDRPGMRVDVETSGEANDPPEKIAHECVQMVTIW